MIVISRQQNKNGSAIITLYGSSCILMIKKKKGQKYLTYETEVLLNSHPMFLNLFSPALLLLLLQ